MIIQPADSKQEEIKETDSRIHHKRQADRQREREREKVVRCSIHRTTYSDQLQSIDRDAGARVFRRSDVDRSHGLNARAKLVKELLAQEWAIRVLFTRATGVTAAHANHSQTCPAT